ncbi:family 20 glycosylhydrolase [Pseudomonas sp. H3(2019)]|uniref:family 20 glycosylhydrolase n=1 Tax=Pseudomonas sp. H3(2019) TaxID=2598724 RepID=UPI0011910B26|nr:family 20 glycosylhydrolase [Pseudomonas sp. H3(2019)]TVT84709.1 family 20 glycosylhydrolase [Pseudomonas sp. H3(2019)]
MTTSTQSPAAALMTAPENLSNESQNVRFPWTHMSPAVLHAEPYAGFVYAISASTRILIDHEGLRPLATRLAFGFTGAAGLAKPPAIVLVSGGNPQRDKGDVELKLSAPDTADVPIPVKGARETYRIDITNALRVTAQTLEAMARALTTLHKAALVSTILEPGVVIDAPAYAERSVLIDVGRKYYSPEWMKNLLREMAWNQLNTLHLHLTDNEGVRVIFPSAQYIASDDAWSAAQLKDILDTAAAYHIEVIPEIETPGHMDWILRNRPQFQLKLSTGQSVSKALDFSIPAARKYLKMLVSDLLDMFPASRHVHLGADEYFLDPISQSNTPQLAQYARDESDLPNATSEDAVRYFVNDLATLVQKRGKIARVWNDGAVQRNPLIALDKKTQIECWSIWGRSHEMNVQELVDAGYTVKNANGDYYFIIRNNWDNLFDPKHSPHGIYDVWRANHFMDKAGAAITEIPADSPYMAGAGIQVWADEPNYRTPEEVWEHLKLWMLPLGQRTWDSPNAAPDYKSLSLIARAVAHPPPVPW